MKRHPFVLLVLVLLFSSVKAQQVFSPGSYDKDSCVGGTCIAWKTEQQHPVAPFIIPDVTETLIAENFDLLSIDENREITDFYIEVDSKIDREGYSAVVTSLYIQLDDETYQGIVPVDLEFRNTTQIDLDSNFNYDKIVAASDVKVGFRVRFYGPTLNAEQKNPTVDDVRLVFFFDAANSAAGKRTGPVVGGVIGGIVAIAAVGALICFFVIRKKKQRKAKKHQSNPDVENVYIETKSKASDNQNLYLNDIEIKKRIGGGHFGDVYEGLWRDVTRVALKKLKTEDDDKEFENEFSLLMKLNHPNVVKMFGLYSSEDKKEKYMVMEYLSKGSLDSFLKKPELQKEIELTDLLFMAVNVAAGMDVLHEKNIIHRDLAARNLLVTQADGKYIVKVADFGMSRELEDENYYNAKDKRFPVKWSPPEVIQKRQFSPKSDVWSFGIVLWEIFEFGNVPYGAFSNVETSEQVLNGYRLPKPDRCPEEVYELMKQCWLLDPKQRPDFRTLFKQLSGLLRKIEKGANDSDSESEYKKKEAKESLLSIYGEEDESGTYNN